MHPITQIDGIAFASIRCGYYFFRSTASPSFVLPYLASTGTFWSFQKGLFTLAATVLNLTMLISGIDQPQYCALQDLYSTTSHNAQITIFKVNATHVQTASVSRSCSAKTWFPSPSPLRGTRTSPRNTHKLQQSAGTPHSGFTIVKQALQ